MSTQRRRLARDQAAPGLDGVARPTAASGVEVLPGMISRGPQVLAIAELVSLVAETNATVLIAGETGTGEYCPVGTAQSHVCDIRVLAATNRDLQQMIAAGQFRQDLIIA